MKNSILLISLLLFSSLAAIAQNGIIKGRVFDPVSNEPIPFANVIIQGTTTGATTDVDGLYLIENLTPGLYNLQCSFIGYKTNLLYEIEVTNARAAIVDIPLEANAEVLKAVEIEADPFSKSEEAPVSLRSIGVNEIKRNPGGARDISRAVQSLPGVASTPTFRNDILIRGGAPSENRFYIDDIEVPTINHFATQGSSGGPVGMINVDFIRDVDFYSGAFPAGRGNTLSSVFDFKFKDGNPDKQNLNFTIGSSDVGLALEGPINENSNYLLSVRRSYLQFLFKAIGLPFLPTYTDIQYKIKTNLSPKNTLTILGIGAIDDFSLNLDANETEEQRYILDNIPVNEQWNYTQGFKFTNFRDNSYTNFIFSRSMLRNTAVKYFENDESEVSNKILDYASDEAENKFRIENILRKNGFKLVTGIGYEFARYTNSTFNRISVQDTVVVIDYDSQLKIHKYGLFAQASKTFLEGRLSTSVGFRMDGNSYSKEMSNPLEQFSPRLSLSYSLTADLALNFNTGIYYQLPPYTTMGYRENGELINKNNGLSYISNRHLVGGIEVNSLQNAKITLEGFYKYYTNYPFALRDSISLANVGGDFGVIGDEPVSSISEGRSYGTEFLFQQKLFKGFYGIVSYTLSWSEFKDKNGIYIPSSWDTRHIFNLVGGKKFKRNWEIGAKWRFVTGSPYTPVNQEVSAIIPVWDVNGLALPDYNRLNSERLGVSHQLDLRIDKKWFFNKWNLNIFLDVENAYGFAPESAPVLTVVRDENGNPLVDPNDPIRYQTKFLGNLTNAAVLPTIGLIVEL